MKDVFTKTVVPTSILIKDLYGLVVEIATSKLIAVITDH